MYETEQTELIYERPHANGRDLKEVPNMQNK